MLVNSHLVIVISVLSSILLRPEISLCEVAIVGISARYVYLVVSVVVRVVHAVVEPVLRVFWHQPMEVLVVVHGLHIIEFFVNVILFVFLVLDSVRLLRIPKLLVKGFQVPQKMLDLPISQVRSGLIPSTDWF